MVRGAVIALALLVAGGLLAACGGGSGGGDTGADELARQRELAEARHQAAQDARQSTKIKDLEQELHRVAKKTRSEPEARVPRPAETPPSQGAQESESDDWPAGTGFTAILASVGSESEARSIQAEATGRGLDAGVLYSSEYSSLRPGYWVVFSGDFPQADDAEARADHAHELGYSDAYPRFVAP